MAYEPHCRPTRRVEGRVLVSVEPEKARHFDLFSVLLRTDVELLVS